MRKFMLLALSVMLVLAFGCSGTAGLTPDRATYQEFIDSCPGYDGIAGTFTITDGDGLVVAEGDLFRDENGLSLGDMRTGDIIIDLTWLNWVDCACDFLNPRGFTSHGWALYWYGDTIEYNLCITNNCCTIPNAIVRVQHRHLYSGALLPNSTKWWYNVNIPANQVTKLYDEYHAIYNGWIAVWALVDFPINWWCIHLDLILYNGICGVWDP